MTRPTTTRATCGCSSTGPRWPRSPSTCPCGTRPGPSSSCGSRSSARTGRSPAARPCPGPTRSSRSCRGPEMAADDAFYRVLEVTVSAPVDWTRLGLTSATVSLAYGDPRHRARIERQDLLFTPARRDDQRWKVYLDPEQGDAYRYRVTYHFDAGSSWHARRWDHALAERTTRAPRLVIDPA